MEKNDEGKRMDKATNEECSSSAKRFHFILAKNKHFIGCGGAGKILLEELTKKKVEGHYIRIKKKQDEVGYIYNATVFEYEDQNDADNFYLSPDLQEFLLKTDNFVILAGFGGKTGTYYTVLLVDFFEKNNKTYQGLITIPFAFEGQLKNNLAKKMFDKLNRNKNIVFYDFDIFSRDIREKQINVIFEKFNAFISSKFSR